MPSPTPSWPRDALEPRILRPAEDALTPTFDGLVEERPPRFIPPSPLIDEAAYESVVIFKDFDANTVRVESAPDTAAIHWRVLTEDFAAHVRYVGGLVVIGDQVAYAPRAFTRDGALVCDRYPWKVPA